MYIFILLLLYYMYIFIFLFIILCIYHQNRIKIWIVERLILQQIAYYFYLFYKTSIKSVK